MNAPTPFWNLLEKDSGRLTHSPGEVWHMSVAGDHKTAIVNKGCHSREFQISLSVCFAWHDSLDFL